MTMPKSDYADLMYLGPRAQVAHWVPWGNHTSLCGLPRTAGEWWGTGDMDEYDHAAILPVCKECGR